jgi:hypothetical protein
VRSAKSPASAAEPPIAEADFPAPAGWRPSSGLTGSPLDADVAAGLEFLADLTARLETIAQQLTRLARRQTEGERELLKQLAAVTEELGSLSLRQAALEAALDRLGQRWPGWANEAPSAPASPKTAAEG